MKKMGRLVEVNCDVNCVPYAERKFVCFLHTGCDNVRTSSSYCLTKKKKHVVGIPEVI